MSKDSYWFRHDSSAGRGIKMRKMQHIYGHWAKGIYWDVVELLRDQDEYKHEKDESSLQLIADLIGCKDDKKFLNWYKDAIKVGLIYETETHFYSPALSRNMVKWDVSKENGKKGGRPKKEAKQQPIKKPKNNPSNNPNDNPNESIIEQYSIEQYNNEEKKPAKAVDWDIFLQEFNTITQKKCRTIPQKARKAISQRIKEGYTWADFKTAITNAANDQYHKDNNLKHLTIEFISRPDKLEKWMSAGNVEKKVPDYLKNPFKHPAQIRTT